jgi:cysteine-rich repeat protein
MTMNKKTWTVGMILLIATVLSATAVSANWISENLPDRGIPTAVALSDDGTKVLMVSEGAILSPCCTSSILNVDLFDLTTSQSSTLEFLNEPSHPLSAVEYQNGIIVLHLLNGGDDSNVVHYSFNGVETQIGSPVPSSGAQEVSHLATDGSSVYMHDMPSDTLYRLDSVSGSWNVVATNTGGWFSVAQGSRNQGAVKSDGTVLFHGHSSLAVYNPVTGFDSIPMPDDPANPASGTYAAGNHFQWFTVAADDTFYGLVRSHSSDDLYMWEISPTGVEQMHPISVERHDYFLTPELSEDETKVYFSGMFAAGGNYGHVYVFDRVTHDIEELNDPQPWAGVSFAQINDIDEDAGVLVAAWETSSLKHVAKTGTSDIDGDGIPDIVDGCPNKFNPGQNDYDGDGAGDVCDACPLTFGENTCADPLNGGAAEECQSFESCFVGTPGGVTVNIPPGALPDGQSVFIEDTGDYSGNFAGALFEKGDFTAVSTSHFIGPEGLTFLYPVEVCFTFETQGLGRCNSGKFQIGKDSDSDYVYENQLLLTSCTDVGASTVEICAETTSFSNFVVAYEGCGLGDDGVVLSPGEFNAVYEYEGNPLWLLSDGGSIGVADPDYLIYDGGCGEAVQEGFTMAFVGGAPQVFCMQHQPSGDMIEFNNVDYFQDDDGTLTATFDITGSGGIFCDADNDEVDAQVDNCPYTYNPDQSDVDLDGVGDLCDHETLDFENDCTDGVDNDGDGATDLLDSDCDIVSFCSLDIQICGNGVLESCTVDPASGCEVSELCDDGNRINGDGCSDQCQFECDDYDGDGYGVTVTAACPAGPEIDCNDADPTIYPGTTQETDLGGGNVGICRPEILACNGDTGAFDIVIDPGQAPELETCDGLDNDCNGATDEVDDDNDAVNDCNFDLCPGSTADIAGYDGLKPNNYHVEEINGQLVWTTNIGSASAPQIVPAALTMAQTNGCGCDDILVCKPGENNGEQRWGCTGGPDGLGAVATVGLFVNEQGWADAGACFDANGIVEGEAKPLFTDTDAAGVIDGFDTDNDNDAVVDSQDLLPDDKDVEDTNPGKGKPDWWEAKNPGK